MLESRFWLTGSRDRHAQRPGGRAEGNGASAGLLANRPVSPPDSFLTFIRRIGIPGGQPRPDPASLDYAAMNKVAGETGQPVPGPPMPEEEARAIVARGR
jgi:hypothetical protein